MLEQCGDELWLAGLMLDWAEGSQAGDVVFSNSDPYMVRFIMKWFRETLHVSEHKLRARLNIHSGQDDQSIKAFWACVTELPLTQFGKSYVKKEGTGHRKNTLYQGTIRIVVCDRNLLHKIRGWIEGVSQVKCGPLA